MNWQSPEQIKGYFSLESDTSDTGDVRRALVKRMALLHPDQSIADSGDAAPNASLGENDALRWSALQSAKEFLEEERKSSQLIAVSEVTNLIETITRSNTAPIDSRVSDMKRDASAEARSRATLPRISSGMLASVCTFLFTSSSSLKDHPLIGNLIQMTSVQMVLLGGAMYAGLFFLLSWSRERRQETLVDFLSSDEGARETLEKVVRDRNRDLDEQSQFSFNHLVERVSKLRTGDRYPLLPFLIGSGRLSRSMAERVANIQVERMAQRGIIVEIPHSGFSRNFEISQTAYSELLDRIRD